jgi:uncharacterized protein YodC (DUF2158 family)
VESGKKSESAAISKKHVPIRDYYVTLNISEIIMSMKRLAAVGIVTLWLTLNALCVVPTFAGSAQANTATESHASSLLKRGDLTRLRSGGTLMTVEDVRDDQVTCSWIAEDGKLQSSSFPIAMLTAAITFPPDEPTEPNGAKAADKYYRKHCPSKIYSFSTGKAECSM